MTSWTVQSEHLTVYEKLEEIKCMYQRWKFYLVWVNYILQSEYLLLHYVSVYSRDSDLELTDNEEDFHYIEVDEGAQSINTITQSFAAMQTSSPGEGHRSRHESEESQPLNLSNKPSDVVNYNMIEDTVTDNLASGNGMCDHDYQRKVCVNCFRCFVCCIFIYFENIYFFLWWHTDMHHGPCNKEKKNQGFITIMPQENSKNSLDPED